MEHIGHRWTTKAAHMLLSRIRNWWQRRELDSIDAREIQRIAAELGMTVSDLRDLASRGPEAAALLAGRMTALGLTRGDVERTALGLMWDLERTCSCCRHKGRCARDLASGPRDRNWESYCPNAIALQAACGAKGRFPA
jgi:hypothetical protein